VILGSESHSTHDHILLSDGSGSVETQNSVSESKSRYDGRSVRLGVEPHLGLMTRFYLLLKSYGFGDGGALSDERSCLSFVAVIVSGLSHLYAVNMYLLLTVLHV
jgi:hypothetical protein